MSRRGGNKDSQTKLKEFNAVLDAARASGAAKEEVVRQYWRDQEAQKAARRHSENPGVEFKNDNASNHVLFNESAPIFDVHAVLSQLSAELTANVAEFTAALAHAMQNAVANGQMDQANADAINRAVQAEFVPAHLVQQDNVAPQAVVNPQQLHNLDADGRAWLQQQINAYRRYENQPRPSAPSAHANQEEINAIAKGIFAKVFVAAYFALNGSNNRQVNHATAQRDMTILRTVAFSDSNFIARTFGMSFTLAQLNALRSQIQFNNSNAASLPMPKVQLMIPHAVVTQNGHRVAQAQRANTNAPSTPKPRMGGRAMLVDDEDSNSRDYTAFAPGGPGSSS